MLQVTNGVLTLKVTPSAFKTCFEPAGYHVLSHEYGVSPSEGINTQAMEETTCLEDSTQQETQKTLNEVSEPESVEGEEEDLSEIPLEDMEFDQLCQYADQLGVDRTGVRSKKILRNLIREELAERG